MPCVAYVLFVRHRALTAPRIIMSTNVSESRSRHRTVIFRTPLLVHVSSACFSTGNYAAVCVFRHTLAAHAGGTLARPADSNRNRCVCARGSPRGHSSTDDRSRQECPPPTPRVRNPTRRDDIHPVSIVELSKKNNNVSNARRLFSTTRPPPLSSARLTTRPFRRPSLPLI